MSLTAEVKTIFDKIADFGDNNGVMDQAGFIFPLLLPLQAGKQSSYMQPKEYSYGPAEKQKLDVYVPPSLSSGEKAPVLVFMYGGGFALGGKRHSPGVYECLGDFFAKKGYIVVVVDYHLIGEGAVHPSGPADLSSALQWLARGSVAEADLKNVFFMGESAGGMHMATYVWNSYPGIKGIHEIPEITLKGLVFLSIIYSRELDKLPPPSLAYYNGAENAEKNFAYNLRKTSNDKTPLLVFYATFDPVDDIASSRAPFLDLYKDPATAPSEIDVVECKGHNHISLPLVLGLDAGFDDWANYLVDWMGKHSS